MEKDEMQFPALPPIPGFSYTGKVTCTTCRRSATVFYQRVEDWHSPLLEMCPSCMKEKHDSVPGV